MTGTLAQTVPTEVRVEHRFEFLNLPQNWGAVLTLLIVGLLCWWVIRTYRIESRVGSTLGARMLLAALRCLVVVLLVVIWLQPAMVAYWHQRIESYTLVLVDASSSLRIEDHFRTPAERAKILNFSNSFAASSMAPPVRRSAVVNQILNGRHAAFLKALSRRNRVHVHTFADETEMIRAVPANRENDIFNDPEQDAPVELNIEYDGPATNLGTGLQRAVEGVSGSPVAGIVVISDGNFNEGEDVDVMGQFARSRNLAIHAVGIGDASEVHNVRIVELVGPTNVFKEDPFELTAYLGASGVENEVVSLELSAQGTGGMPSRVVGRKMINIETDGMLPAVTFAHQEQQAGKFNYTLQVTPLAGETVTQDNRENTYVNVLDNRMKVLLVSGGPSWNYRYLSRLLTRDGTFDVSCWLQSADRRAVRDGNTIIDHLPATTAELFAYDAVILLDPDPRELPENWAELLDRHVAQNAGGLMYCAARKQASHFFRAPTITPIVELLPVVPDPEADLILNQIGYYQKSGSPVEIPDSAKSHPSFLSAGGERPSNNPLKTLTRVYWHYPVKHEKPAANVLMRHGHPRMRNSYGGHVLLATQFVGAGRSGFMAFDATWRWRRYGEEVYERFWVQMIRYLAEGRLLGQHPRGRIQSDKQRYLIGEPVVIDARLTDSEFAPLAAPEMTAMLTRVERASEEKQTLELQANPNRPGWYQGQFMPKDAGRYVIRVELPTPGSRSPARLTHEIDVRESDLETRSPQMDRARLRMLASNSAAGKYYDVDQIDEIAETIEDRHETRVTRGSAEPVWNKAWMLFLLIGILSGEWALRKKWQLL